MSRLLQDVRFGLRALLRRPLFAVVAGGSLAVGIGANTALFSAVNGLLLRPLPGMPNQERVVELGRSRDGGGFDTFTYPDYRDLRDGVPALASAAAYSMASVSVAQEEEGVRAYATYASPSYFEVLGLTPARGRFFDTAENQGEGAPVAVVSWDFWQDRLGGDPAIVGSTVRINRDPYTVVGVAPEDFRGHMIGFRPNLYLPLARHPEMAEYAEHRNASWHFALGLVSPDADLGALNTQLAAVGRGLAEAYPESNSGRSFSAIPLGPVPGGGRGTVRVFLGVLMGLVGLVLLVTCANVAGMFLARAATRQREVAVRLALGAGRHALVRQLTVEALLVFLLGGALGWMLAAWATGLLRPDLLPLPIPLDFDLSPDARVLAFSLAATLGTGLLFGLLPALQATRLELAGVLREAGAGTSGGRRGSRLRKGFVATQVGLSLVLLMAAGLFLRSLQRAAATETGFDPTDAYVTALDLSLEGYDVESGRLFQARLVDELRRRAWVGSAALSTDLPLDLGASGTGAIPEGWPADASEPGLPIDYNQVSPGYFEALRIPLLAGRGFTDEDRPGAEYVAVVSRTFADRAWPGESALGRTLRFGSFDPERGTVFRVVGVSEDVKNQTISEEAKAFVYTPLAQNYSAETMVVVRADGGLDRVAPALRQAILDVDRSLSLDPVLELEAYTGIGVLPQRLAAGLTTVLGLLALLLSGLGVYGVVAYAVGRQTREIGIRMALGADRRRVLGRVLAGGLFLTLPGLAAGALVALGVSRVMRGFLLGLSPFDPVTLAGVALTLGAVVGVATLVPARRAASVDPAVALRGE